MTPTSIHDFPVELLQNIFVLACIDGGYTGRALSLVSKSFHSAIQPIQYHSVQLAGLHGISSFITSFKKVAHTATHTTPTQLRPRVRYLFVMSHSDMRHRSVYAHEEPDKAEALAACVELLALLAPDLYTLVLCTCYRHTDLFQACNVGFPLLRNITMGRIQGVDAPDLGARKLPAVSPFFPALRRLHFAMRTLPRNLERVLIHWTVLAPQTTELRLSNVPGRAPRAGLRTAFCKPPESSVIIFPELQKLWIQPFTLPDPVHSESESATALEELQDIVSAVEEIGRSCKEDVSVMLLPRDVDMGAQHAVDLEAGWKDGIVSGEGFWVGGRDVRSTPAEGREWSVSAGGIGKERHKL